MFPPRGAAPSASSWTTCQWVHWCISRTNHVESLCQFQVAGVPMGSHGVPVPVEPIWHEHLGATPNTQVDGIQFQ